MAKSDFSCVETRSFPGSCHSAAVLQTQVPKLSTDLDFGLLYILILGTHSRFARKNNFLALGVCFPQPCSSAGRKFAASRSCLQNYWRIFGFRFLGCYTATQLATQIRQRCIQLVCSNKEARKRLTESNGTPAMNLLHMNVVLKQCYFYVMFCLMIVVLK